MTANRTELNGAGNNHESATDRAEYLEAIAARTMVAASFNPTPGRPEGMSDEAYADWAWHAGTQPSTAD